MTDLYTPLDIESYQIRILRLFPGEVGSIVRCHLERHALVNPPKYTALSYCWGDEADKRPIMVNNMQVLVTANLEDALHRLRGDDLELVWADALCINQADNQEKSLQVRNMKQVYAKAESTYAWLGGSEGDDAAGALTFLRSLAIGAARLDDMPKLAHAGSKETTQQDSSSPDTPFRSIVDLCNRPYWRRRWVIQETTTAAHVRIVCGDQVLDLDQLADALHRCSKSSQWQPLHHIASRFLQMILNFRKAYHNEQSLKLCGTISATKDSLSKDDRDKAFALMGICTDGSELIPTPNYHQSVPQVMIDLTREIIRRNARFDLILVDHRDRCEPSSLLPTWCPDWFSKHLPEDAHIVAEEEQYLARLYGTQSLRGHFSTLYVQGFEFGTVVATTTILGPSSPSMAISNSEVIGTSLIRRSASKYYGKLTLAAILTCLVTSTTEIENPFPTHGSVHLHFFLKALQYHTDHKSREYNEAGHSRSRAEALSSWLSQNAGFVINNRRLGDWFKESQSQFCLHVLHIIFYKQLFATIFMSVMGTVLLAIILWGVVGVPSMIFLYLEIAAFAGSLIAVNAYGTYVLICAIKADIEKSLESFLLPTSRLILMDNGAVGIASSGVEVGDKICMIAGCTMAAAILRECSAGDQITHAVVGKSKICLSEEDEKKYRAFSRTAYFVQREPANIHPSRGNNHCNGLVSRLKWQWKMIMRSGLLRRIRHHYPALNTTEYNEMIEEYKLRGDWKNFILV